MKKNQKEIVPYNSGKGKKKEVEQMFDNIAWRYDFLNHFLSLGIDKSWRKKALRNLHGTKIDTLLDIACGTGDFTLLAAKKLKPQSIYGLDLSANMLNIAKQKSKHKIPNQDVTFIHGDAENLPFEENKFDAAIVAFGVRNFENLEKGLIDIYRVLKPGAKFVVLEFSNQNSKLIKGLFKFYFNKILPAIGALFSKDNRAYKYLPDSVDNFPSGTTFLRILEDCGFKNGTAQKDFLGICGIYTGEK
ncbi:bifunctional demethylmenaquinone methyltransferase/2-methoxy-6-polyprenyl-1,4-benzoquinol methylase UbiE [Bacteroidales bacterium]|nr:bifunctional demethylmenaquinone methyltransferase/2-methoxy-6-polyprenyl-1,4-benzoquinol methylase UbiE [Bacteroidales bacterium]